MCLQSIQTCSSLTIRNLELMANLCSFVYFIGASIIKICQHRASRAQGLPLNIDSHVQSLFKTYFISVCFSVRFEKYHLNPLMTRFYSKPMFLKNPSENCNARKCYEVLTSFAVQVLQSMYSMK